MLTKKRFEESRSDAEMRLLISEMIMPFCRTRPTFFLSSPPNICGNSVSAALVNPWMLAKTATFMMEVASEPASSSFVPMKPQNAILTIGKNICIKLLRILCFF